MLPELVGICADSEKLFLQLVEPAIDPVSGKVLVWRTLWFRGYLGRHPVHRGQILDAFLLFANQRIAQSGFRIEELQLNLPPCRAQAQRRSAAIQSAHRSRGTAASARCLNR